MRAVAAETALQDASAPRPHCLEAVASRGRRPTRPDPAEQIKYRYLINEETADIVLGLARDA